ncbi:MAG: helix-hairpin-helix domain-containing protein [Bacteroidota bacterium]
MNMENMHFKDLFSFSGRERKGIFVLLIILILLIVLRTHMHLLFPRENKSMDPYFISEVENFLRSGSSESPKAEVSPIRKIDKESARSESTPSQLFYFDPNTINNREWKKLGISDGQLKVINNFKQSGGKFFKKEDVKKIYGMDENTYARLEKYIKIKQPSPETKEIDETSKKDLPVIEINTADTFHLTLLRGIGPTYARRICKYRDLLGGFSSKEQLKEVYGITEELVSLIDSTINIDREQIRTIDVNKAKFGELIRHPYLNEFQTKAIIQYRQFKERINDLRELVSNNILDEKTYFRMEPYLEVSEE